MSNKKGINIIFVIIALITGGALLKQFEFETLKFEKPAMAVIYFVAFAGSVYFLIKDLISKK